MRHITKMIKAIKWDKYILKFNRPLIMGILNVTPDSFSDGGKFLTFRNAVEHGERMAGEGADIIDIGGESTRPYSKPVSAEEEISRVIPVIKKLRKKISVPISIDTYKSKVAEESLKVGANIINDISALRMDSEMGRIAAKYKIPIILMHMKGRPQNMQEKPCYKNLVSEIISFLQHRVESAKKEGIDENKIIVDPGIGFGKTVKHNLEIIRRLNEFKSLGRPLLIGPSRKSFIGKVLNLDVSQRLEGTAAAVAVCVWNGANIIRVHDVKEMKRVVDVTWEIYSE